MLSGILVLYVYLTLFLTGGISVYGVVAKRNIVKKIIALTIFNDAVNTIAIFIGYRLIPRPLPPIMPTIYPNRQVYSAFISSSVDPLPQALVITAIVIGVAVTCFLAFLAIRLYDRFGTTDYQEIKRLVRGGKR